MRIAASHHLLFFIANTPFTFNNLTNCPRRGVSGDELPREFSKLGYIYGLC